MKKTVAFIMVLILLVSMCACNDLQLPNNDSKQSQSENNQQTPNEEVCEHIWDDGIEVEGGIGGYVMEYTCTVCGKKDQQIITIIPPYYVTEDDIVDKVYVYEKEGFGGGSFTIQIKADGTFTYYEGMLSSHIGSGEWSYSDGMLTLFEKMYRLNETGKVEQVTKSYSFVVEKDTLIFVDNGLELGLGNFLYVTVKHGEKFIAQ